VRVLGIDPGGTTGLAVIDSDTRSLHVRELDFVETIDWLYMAIHAELSRIDRVAIERYVITGRTAKLSRQTEALEVIGWTRGLCQICEIPITLQEPSAAKTAWSNERLRAAGLWTPAKDHAQDATRHAAFLLQNHGIVLKHAGTTASADETEDADGGDP